MKFPITAKDVETFEQCPCCERADQLADVAEVSEESGIVILTTSVCKACSMIIRRRRPAREWFERMWSVRAEAQQRHGGTPFNPAIEEKRYERYAWTAAMLKRHGARGNVIDIGCGPATGLRAFAEAGFQATGLEPDHSRSRFVTVPEVEIIEATVEQFAATEQRRFDLVTCQHSLEHFHDPRQVMTAIASLASMDALIFIEVPDWHNFVTNWEDALYLAHLSNFIPETLVRLGQSVGLEPLAREYPASDVAGEAHLAYVFRKVASVSVPPAAPIGPSFVEQVRTVYGTGLTGTPPKGPVRFVVPHINDVSLTIKSDPTQVRAMVHENYSGRVAVFDAAAGVYRVQA